MSILWFALGSLLTFLAAGALSVLAAAGGSFQLLSVLALVAALLMLVGFGPAAAIARRFPRRNPALLLGCISACVFMALVWIAFAAGADPRQSWPLLLALPLLGAAAPFVPAGTRD